MILHLIRHPPPQIAEGTCYGHLDMPALGVESAAERLRGLLPAGLPVYCSTLARCRQLAEALHPAPLPDPRLKEMHFGEWEGRRWDDIDVALLDAWADDVAGYAPPGGECGWQVLARAQAFLNELTADEAVLVTHAGVMRALLAHWQGVPADGWLELRFDYAALTSVELLPGKARVLHINR